jgi:hypothetical protein
VSRHQANHERARVAFGCCNGRFGRRLLPRLGAPQESSEGQDEKRYYRNMCHPPESWRQRDYAVKKQHEERDMDRQGIHQPSSGLWLPEGANDKHSEHDQQDREHCFESRPLHHVLRAAERYGVNPRARKRPSGSTPG